MAEQNDKQKLRENIVNKRRKDFEMLFALNSNELAELLNLIGFVGDNGLKAQHIRGSFALRILEGKFEEALDKFSHLKDKPIKEISRLAGTIMFMIHLLEQHDSTVEEILEEIDLEDEKVNFNNVISTVRSHEAYPEMYFILETFGDRLTGLNGRLITAEIKDVTMKYFELILSYLDINYEEKHLRLEMSRKQLQSIISDLTKLLGE